MVDAWCGLSPMMAGFARRRLYAAQFNTFAESMERRGWCVSTSGMVVVMITTVGLYDVIACLEHVRKKLE